MALELMNPGGKHLLQDVFIYPQIFTILLHHSFLSGVPATVPSPTDHDPSHLTLLRPRSKCT